MAVNPFLQLGVIRDASKGGRMITDCYRLMYNRDLWVKANAALGHSKGTVVLSLQKINEIIEQLKANTFRFSSVKNVCNLKVNDNKRPLAASCLRDMLVKKVMEIILTAIYEPVFTEYVHGYGEGKGYDTALSQIINTWNGITWCIRCDINELFDQTNHIVLIKYISQKVADRRFLLLIHNALKCGMMSQLLADVYLHRFDLFMKGQIKLTKVKYVRYGGSFVIGVAGNKATAMKIEADVQSFLGQKMMLESDKVQTFITHLKKTVPFLGYEFRICRDKIQLEIPASKLRNFALENHYGNMDDFKITHRPKLINYTELEIIMIYNGELRGIADYYRLANHDHNLDKLFYLARGSFIKTIANKRRSTSTKVSKSMMKHKQDLLCLEGHDKKGSKVLYEFLRLKDIRGICQGR